MPEAKNEGVEAPDAPYEQAGVRYQLAPPAIATFRATGPSWVLLDTVWPPTWQLEPRR